MIVVKAEVDEVVVVEVVVGVLVVEVVVEVVVTVVVLVIRWQKKLQWKS